MTDTTASLTRACPNCGSTQVAAYCAHCGQAQDEPVRSFARLVLDYIEDAFAYDSRVLRTLRVLLLAPGAITVDYLDGRRARYVPPLRLYLFVSLLYFVVSALVGPPGPAVQMSEAERAELAREFAPALPPGTDPGKVELSLDGVDPETQAFFKDLLQRVADDPATFEREFRQNIPTALFLFVPFVALVLRAILAFTPALYVQHVIFVLHVHSFFFATLLLATLVEALPGPGALVGTLARLYLPVYLWRALRRVYPATAARTTLRFALLGTLGYGVSALAMLLLALLYTALRAGSA